jgi:hypothetical protein
MIELVSEDVGKKQYVYRLTGMTRWDLTKDMTLFWEQLLTRIQTDRQDGSWNRLYFECWIYDQAYVLAYPQKRGESPDYRVPEVKVCLDYLVALQPKVDAAESDEAVENLVHIAYLDVREAIQDGYRRQPALVKLKQVMAANDFTAWTMEEGNRESMMEFEIFFRSD